MVWRNRMVALLAVVLLGACGGEEPPETEVEAVVAEPAAGMEGMGGMQVGGGMMEQMQAHMQQMQGVNGEQIQANLPQHRQMVANMISQMNREMREMNMTTDQEWNSTIDAIRQDLTRLPEMDVQELETFMPEHRQRVERLMEMHRSMMGNMQM